MEPIELKQRYGHQIVFWGGGVDTQKTIARGTPDEVYREVRERIAIFNQGGGMVFNAIHNIQGNTPTENMLAMFAAIRDSAEQGICDA
jgi:uroporphyrinogen-III decarboxylase